MATGGWRAGVAKVCITPDEPICLDGWGSRISQGVSMDIWSGRKQSSPKTHTLPRPTGRHKTHTLPRAGQCCL